MKIQITTTLDSLLVKKAKHEAVNLNKSFNYIIEQSLILYFYSQKNEDKLLLKKCSECNQEKELTAYYKDSHQKDGVRNKCKQCTGLAEANRKKKIKFNDVMEDLK